MGLSGGGVAPLVVILGLAGSTSAASIFVVGALGVAAAGESTKEVASSVAPLWITSPFLFEADSSGMLGRRAEEVDDGEGNCVTAQDEAWSLERVRVSRGWVFS